MRAQSIGQSLDFDFAVDLPDDPMLQNEFFGIRIRCEADADEVIDESNERNNTDSEQFGGVDKDDLSLWIDDALAAAASEFRDDLEFKQMTTRLMIQAAEQKNAEILAMLENVTIYQPPVYEFVSSPSFIEWVDAVAWLDDAEAADSLAAAYKAQTLWALGYD